MSAEYVLRLGDNALILGQQLSAWTGHGPILEEDIALANVALDLLGQCRALLSYAGELEGAGRDEDALAFKRDVLDFQNVLLVEDLTTDGGSKISFVDAIRDTGATCAHTAVIFYYDIFPETTQTLGDHGVTLH